MNKYVLRGVVILGLLALYFAGDGLFNSLERKYSRPVTFQLDLSSRLEDEDAESFRLNYNIKEVYIAGEFSGWSTDDPLFRMEMTQPHCWQKSLSLSPGMNPYKFVLRAAKKDLWTGKEIGMVKVYWLNDPGEKNRVPDGLGGANSLHIVKTIAPAQTVFRFLVRWLIACLILYTLFEWIIQKLFHAPMSLKHKIAVVFTVFLVVSNIYFVIYTQEQKVEALKKSLTDQINTLHIALSLQGVNFSRLDDPDQQKLLDDTLDAFFEKSVQRRNYFHFSNVRQRLNTLFVCSTNGEILAWGQERSKREAEWILLKSWGTKKQDDLYRLRFKRLNEILYRPGAKPGVFFFNIEDYFPPDNYSGLKRLSSRIKRTLYFDYNSFYYPIRERLNTVGYYVGYFDPAADRVGLRQMLWLNVALIGVLTVLYFLLITFLGDLMLLPLHRLIQALRFVEEGNLEHQIDIRTRDEIENLGNAYNYMARELRNSYDQIREHSRNLEKRVEERTAELKDANQKLRELDRIKTQFFANVSHELRTPLTLILVPLESLLKDASLAPETRNHLEIMYQNGLRLLRLINSLLELSRIEAGKTVMNYRRVKIADLIGFYLRNLGSFAQTNRITVELKTADSGLELYVDLERMEKICMNLLSNALKFTPEGGKITVEIRDKGKKVEIRFSDTGCGIPPEKLPHIFDRFMQDDYKRKGRFEGTGLGLYLVKNLVELHGGSVSVKSKVGKGSEFLLVLPQGTEHVHDTDRLEDRLVQNFQEDHYLFSALKSEISRDKSKTEDNRLEVVPGVVPLIVVVEDDPDLRTVLTTILRDKYRIETAADGEDGLRLIRELKPDLVLSDVMMPRMSGLELCTALDKEPAIRHIPVILLTARADIADKVEGLRLGAVDYIYKPFGESEVLYKIETLFRLQRYKQALVDRDRLSTLGMMAGGLMHEIKNPVNYILGNIEPLFRDLRALEEIVSRQGTGREEYSALIRTMESTFEVIRKGAERIDELASSLKVFLRQSPAQKEKVNIKRTVLSILEILKRKIGENVTVDIRVDDRLEIETHSSHLTQVLTNLLHNALDAMKDGGTLTVSAKTDKKQAVIEVADTGTGIVPEIRDRIFSPFFTTKEIGEGVGLGLYLSRFLAQSIGGDLSFESEPGRRTVFQLSLRL